MIWRPVATTRTSYPTLAPLLSVTRLDSGWKEATLDGIRERWGGIRDASGRRSVVLSLSPEPTSVLCAC